MRRLWRRKLWRRREDQTVRRQHQPNLEPVPGLELVSEEEMVEVVGDGSLS